MAHKSLAELPTFTEDGDVHVVVETPRRSRNKYAFDPKLGQFKLRNVLPIGLYFPYDFGFVPSTLADDGDPIDVLLLADEPACMGSVIEARLVGVIEAEQVEEEGEIVRNDRLIAVPCLSPAQAHVRTLADVGAARLDEMEEFFRAYAAQRKKQFVAKGRHGPKRALELVRDAHAKFTRKRTRRVKRPKR